MSRKINIAIDGHSSCGKSTLAKSIAKELNYVYIDSGAMYRAVTLYALQHGFIRSENDVDMYSLARTLPLITINFKYNFETGMNEVFLNGQNVEREIRAQQVSNYVSPVSAVPEVRAKMVRLQKRMCEVKGVVMDGRDIGTVVMPDAELKFFMTADSRVRAQRRYDELLSYGFNPSFEDIYRNINSRDEIDSTRATDPLRRADDAIVIDNTHLTIEEQYVFVMKRVHDKLHQVDAVA